MCAIIQWAEAEAPTEAWNILGEKKKKQKTPTKQISCVLLGKQTIFGYTLIRQGEQEVTTGH